MFTESGAMTVKVIVALQPSGAVAVITAEPVEILAVYVARFPEVTSSPGPSKFQVALDPEKVRFTTSPMPMVFRSRLEGLVAEVCDVIEQGAELGLTAATS